MTKNHLHGMMYACLSVSITCRILLLADVSILENIHHDVVMSQNIDGR